jgi:hypothetical protein
MPLNEDTAFMWFSKSILPDYEISLFSRDNSLKGSRFNYYSYQELANLYKKGKGVDKDKKISKALKKTYEYYNRMSFDELYERFTTGKVGPPDK